MTLLEVLDQSGGPMCEAAAARIRELENAVRWACGEIGDFPGEDTSKGRYHWRRELRLRAGVPFVPPSERETSEAPK